MSRLLALAALALTGCLNAPYRYIDVPLPPEQAAAKLEQDAVAEGITVAKPTCAAVVCDRATFALHRGGAWTYLDLAPHGAGTRVELTGPQPNPVIPASLGALPERVIVPAPHEEGWSDVIVHDGELSGGVERDPRVGLGWRTNLAAQIGARVLRWGDLGDAPRTGYSLSLLGGGGLTVSSTGPALMPELTLSLDRQTLVAPMPGERLPLGPRDALDLTLAGRLLDDEKDVGGMRVSSRNGLELGLTLRRVGVGGITARVGELWGPGGGRTAMLGVRALSPRYAAYVTAGLAALTVLVLVAEHPGTVQVSQGAR